MKAWKDANAYKILKQENVRRYYKYDTSNPTYNYTPVGAIVNTNGVLSGFTSSIYATIVPPFVPMSDSWEIIFKFTTGTNISSEQYVFASQRGASGATHGIFFEIKSSKIFMRGSTNGSSWNINTGSTTTLTTNTTYWLKGVFDGSTYKLYLSTDGTNFTQEGTTVTNSNPIYLTLGVSRIGVYGNAAGYPFNGTVDLKESYINIGGGKWWEGVTYPIIAGTSSDYDFYRDETVYSAFNIQGELTTGLIIDAIKEQGFNNAFGDDLENAEEYYIPLFYEGDIPTIVSIDPSSVQVSLPEHLIIDGIDFGFNFLLLMKDTTFSPETEMYFFACLRDRETGDLELYELYILAVDGDNILLRFNPYDLCNYYVTSVPFYFGEGYPSPVETTVRIKIPSNYEILSGQDYP